MSTSRARKGGHTVFDEMPSSNQAAVKALYRYFRAFLASLSPESRASLGVHKEARELADVAKDSELTFEIGASYLSFYARSAEGIAEERVTSQTLIAHASTLFLAYRLASAEVDDKIRKQLIVHCQEEIAPALELRTSAKIPTFTNEDVAEHVVATLFTDAVFYNNARRKLETLVYLSTSFDSGQRVCEAVGREVKAGEDPSDISRLTWDVVSFKATRGVDGECNDVLVKVPLVGTKNPEDEGEIREFGFKPGEPVHRSPALGFLALAQIDGVFPHDWAIQRLFDPSGIPPTLTSIVIDTNESARGRPVLRTRDGRAWTPKNARYSLEAASMAAGLSSALLPHAIRRSVAVSMTLAGAYDEEIQGKLLHSWSSKVLDKYRAQVIPIDATAAVHDEPNEDKVDSRGISDLLPNHPYFVKTIKPVKMSAEERAEIISSPALRELEATHDSLVSSLLRAEGVKRQGDLSSRARQTIATSHQHYRRSFIHLVGEAAKAQKYDDSADSIAEPYFPTAEEADGSLGDAIAFVATVETEDVRLAEKVKQALSTDPQTVQSARAAVDEVKAANERLTQCDSDMAASIADGGDGTAYVQSRSTLNAVREIMLRPAKPSDISAIVDLCVDFVTEYSPGFRPGHAPANGRCRTCSRTIDEILRLRERSVHGRITLSEPEVVDEPPHLPNRLRHIRSHTIRCAERAAIHTQAPEILKKLQATVPEKALSPQGSELKVENYPNVLARLYGYDFIGEKFREVYCRLCSDHPVLKSRKLAIAHLLLFHHIRVPYTAPPSSVPPFTAASIDLEAMWDSASEQYVVNPWEQHELALRVLRKHLNDLPAPQALDPKSEELSPGPKSKEHVDPSEELDPESKELQEPDAGQPKKENRPQKNSKSTEKIAVPTPHVVMGVHPNIIVPDWMKSNGTYDERFDSDSGLCLLCATDCLLPPVEQARFYKDLRAHLATCLRSHLRLLIDLSIDPLAHATRFETTHLCSDNGPRCPHPRCPPLEQRSLLSLVWHLAACHGVYFSGTSANTEHTWRPSFRNPVAVQDLTFSSDKALLAWATEGTSRNTAVMPNLPSPAEIKLPSIDGTVEIQIPLDLDSTTSRSLNVFKTLDLWKQANPKIKPQPDKYSSSP